MSGRIRSDDKNLPQTYDTDYELGQDNVEAWGFDVHNPVFFVSAAIIVVFVGVTLALPAVTKEFFEGLRTAVTSNFDWLFILAGNVFVVFTLYLIVSPFGHIRLGGLDARPEFSFTGWLAMLFAAGMGIGLMFFGVLEPVAHFQKPPLFVSPENIERARDTAMAATIYHWGLHPWAIYAVVGLSLAFFSYNRGLPLTIRSVFYPLLGDRVWGWPGHVIDTLAVFATLFGLATSLGFGAEQALAGMNYLFGVPATDINKVILIACITGMATLSVVAGLDSGVKRLSEINMVLAFALLVFVIIAGPTAAIITGFFDSLASYAWRIVPLSNPVGRDEAFLHGWTTFYWAWWISWSPFVGMFIARVSRGRTVREFLICVLIVPTLVSVLWMTTFGGTALVQLIDGGYQGVAETVSEWQPELSLYKMLEPLPLTGILSFIGIVLVIVFFVTSSDSGSLVIDTITSGGKLEPPVAQRIFWAVFEGLVAIALMLGGGLASLQAAAIATGLPFAIVLLGMCYCLYSGLRAEQKFLSA
ncbi:MAG: BCCT family transporter [Alphaproteobacteria bacterium]|nr:BCCT family transporter [Alphaproteobacteria bacterium]